MNLLPGISASIVIALVVLPVCAQVNSGSNGSDDALDFSSITNGTNIVIDMHNHPTGIYNYTSVNIPAKVTVTFIPNANNTPVVWLVQSNVLNSQITVTVKPAMGPAVSATGANSSGTTASSTATISINIPRGGGLIYATATTAP